MGLLPARQVPARLLALPAPAAMVYHDSTALATAVPALIRPNLTCPSPARSVPVRAARPDDAGPRPDVAKQPPTQVDHPARRVSRPLALRLDCRSGGVRRERRLGRALPGRVQPRRPPDPLR